MAKQVTTNTTNSTGTITKDSTGTTTPVAPDWLTNLISQAGGAISQVAGQDPSSFVATGSTPLEESYLYTLTHSGFGQMPRHSLEVAQKLAAAGATAGPSQIAMPELGPIERAQAVGYSAPTVSAVLAALPYIKDKANTYEAAQAATTLAEKAAQIGEITKATPQSVLENLEAYMSPYTDDVVATTLANMDADADKVRNAQKAKAAGSGAFGGSRYAILEAQTEGELARERAAREAALRDEAFKTGADLSKTDAGFRQEAEIFNAGAANTRALTQAELDNAIILANQEAANNMARFNVGEANDAGEFGANAQNEREEFGANLERDINISNSQIGTEANIASGKLAAEAAAASAAAQNAANLANAAANNRRQEFLAELGVDVGKTNAQLSEDFLGRLLEGAGTLNSNAAGFVNQEQAYLDQLLDGVNLEREIADRDAAAPITGLNSIIDLIGALPTDAVVGSTSTENTTGTTTENSTSRGTGKTKKGVTDILGDVLTAAAAIFSPG